MILPISEIQTAVANYCADKPFEKVCLFGSYYYRRADKDSDVDLLADFNKPISLLTKIRFQQELEQLLGVKVDLVSSEKFKNRLRKKGELNRLKVLYERK